MRDLIRLSLDVAEARLPFRISTTVNEGTDEGAPVFFVTLVNRTKAKALFVHRVRIHYGNRFSGRAFVLMPRSTVEIHPRSEHDFHLSFPNANTEIQRALLQKSLPNFRRNDCPSVSSGADLFKAIAYGRENDSWIEIDFNEFVGRQFRRGLVKREFAEIGIKMAALPHPWFFRRRRAFFR